jgi:hypothetical protein
LDDLLAEVGMLVMIEQQGVLWARSIYESPMLTVIYAMDLTRQTMVWWVRPTSFVSSSIAINELSSFFTLARGSILASVIRFMPGGPPRIETLSISRLLVAFSVVAVAQIV